MGFTSYSVAVSDSPCYTVWSKGVKKTPGEATGHRDMVWETARTRHSPWLDSTQRRRDLHVTASSFTGCWVRGWKK